MLRRVGSVLGLTLCLAGLPVVLRAAAGPPSLAGLPSWQWLRDGLRDQYLPAAPIMHALGLLAWSLWGYAVIVAVLRVLAVVAARRRVAGAAALLALSNLVTLAPVRGLLDTSIGVGLLAASTRATPTPTTAAAPVAVVRTMQPQVADDGGGWDRARPLLRDTQVGSLGGEPTLAQPDPPPLGRAASPEPTRADLAAPAHPPARTPTRTYTVEVGDSLWRIAERQLGDPLRWKEIWALNQGRDMGGGQPFRHAGLIRPGWVLHLPAHTEPATAPPSSRANGEDHGATSSSPAPPQPPAAPPPSTKAPTTSTTGTDDGPSATAPAAAQPTRHGRDRGHDVLDLPSGAVVGFTLAAGIAFALAILRLRRRARRRLGHPDDLAEPEVGQTTRQFDRFAHQRTAALATVADEPDQDDEQEPPPPPHPPFAPSDLHTTHPGCIVIAERDGEELAVDLVGHGAIVVTGAHAKDAARAVVASLLSSGNPYAAEVILASPTLLGEVADFPGLRRIPDLPSAADAVERELLGRARLFEHYDAPDFVTMRAEHPDDQQPALLLVCDQLPGEHAGRLAALLAQGPRLGVGALLVATTGDPSVDGAAHLHLDDTGRIQGAVPHSLGDGQLVGARILRLSEPEVVELLGVLAASRADPAEHHPEATLIPVTEPRTARTIPPARPIPTPTEPPPTPPPRAAELKVRVRLLGAYRIETRAGEEIATGLRQKAREALAYCLLHPDGRTSEQVIDQVLPDVELARGPQRFWNTMTNIRSVLRSATGIEKLPAVERAGPLYRPDPEVFEVDVWQVQAALRAAHRAADDGELMMALEQVAASYTANLLESPSYAWAEPLREELRRRAVDALARLAELHQQAGNPDRALAVLEQAISADRYAEELYQRIMRLQAALDRPDAVQRTFRILEDRLDELELDPTDATMQLVVALTRTPRPSKHPSR